MPPRVRLRSRRQTTGPQSSTRLLKRPGERSRVAKPQPSEQGLPPRRKPGAKLRSRRSARQQRRRGSKPSSERSVKLPRRRSATLREKPSARRRGRQSAKPLRKRRSRLPNARNARQRRRRSVKPPARSSAKRPRRQSEKDASATVMATAATARDLRRLAFRALLGAGAAGEGGMEIGWRRQPTRLRSL